MTTEQSTEPVPRPRRCHRLRVALLLLLAVLYAGYRVTLHAMIQAKLNAIRAQGYPVTFEDLNAWYAEPQLEGNAAAVYAEAFALLQTSPPNFDPDSPINALKEDPSQLDLLPKDTKEGL